MDQRQSMEFNWLVPMQQEQCQHSSIIGYLSGMGLLPRLFQFMVLIIARLRRHTLMMFTSIQVLISGTATTGTANSAAFRKAAGNVFNLKNNIFYNARTNSAGTGTHWAIAVNNTTFTSIGNNDYFARWYRWCFGNN